MSPPYEPPLPVSDVNSTHSPPGSGPDDEAMADAAEALRQAEVEAVQPDVGSIHSSDLATMSIDELRTVAGALGVPDRSKIIEQDELIEAIRRRLPR